jgi:hypothetical protein
VGEQKKTKIQNAFGRLLEEAGYGDIPDLVAEINKIPGTKHISRAQLYNIRNGTTTPKLATLQRLAEALSFRGTAITADIIASRLKLPGAKQEVQEVSSYLSKLEAHLQEKLDEIPYIERNLAQVGGEKAENWTVSDIIDRRQHTLILGEPGIGKSTLLDKIALEAAKAGRIPVYLDLRFCFKEDVEGFKEELANQAMAYGGNSTIGVSLVEEGLETLDELVILIDHLDQVNPVYGRIICRLATILKSQTIVSCRSQYEGHYSVLVEKGIVGLGLAELDRNAIKESVNKQGLSFSAYGQAQQNIFFEMGTNPYRLKMLLAVLKSPEPSHMVAKTSIYISFVNAITRTSLSSQQRKTPVGLRLKATASLAYAMQVEKNAPVLQREWAEDHLHRIIAETRQEYVVTDPSAVIEDIIRDNLIIYSSDGAYCIFAHDSLRSFFSAWHLAHNVSQEDARATILLQTQSEDKIYTPEWEEIIVHYAGIVDDASDVILAIMDESHDDIFRHNLCLAGKCINEAKSETIERIGGECVRRIVEAFPENSNNYLYCKLGETLALHNIKKLLANISAEEEDNKAFQEKFEHANGAIARQGINLHYPLHPVVDHSSVLPDGTDRIPFTMPNDKQLQSLVQKLREDHEELRDLPDFFWRYPGAQRVIPYLFPMMSPQLKMNKQKQSSNDKWYWEASGLFCKIQEKNYTLKLISSLNHQNKEVRTNALKQWLLINHGYHSYPDLKSLGIPDKYAIESQKTQQLADKGQFEAANTFLEWFTSPYPELRDDSINILLHIPWEKTWSMILRVSLMMGKKHITKDHIISHIREIASPKSFSISELLHYEFNPIHDFISKTRLKVPLSKEQKV